MAVAHSVRMRFPILFAALLFAACTTEADGATGADETDGAGGAASATDTAPFVATTATGAGWSNDAVPPQAGVFHIVFALVPEEQSGAPIDAVVGLSSGPAKAFTDLGPIVRFSPAGTLDVRDGSTYASDVPYAYKIGETYQIRMDVDLKRHLYSVLVEENGGPATQLARDYTFRTEQATVAKLNNAARFTDSASGSLEQIAFDVAP